MDRLASPLESLVDFCSDLHEKGITAEQTVVSTQTDKADLPAEEHVKEEKEEKKELICYEHSACFYCEAHSKYMDQKPPVLRVDSAENQEYKGICRWWISIISFHII